MGKKVECLYCGQKYTRAQYPEHLEESHHEDYLKLIESIKNDLGNGLSLKEVAVNHNVTEQFVKKTGQAKNCPVKDAGIQRWEPENFNLETTTVWSFPDRGDWPPTAGNTGVIGPPLFLGTLS